MSKLARTIAALAATAAVLVVAGCERPPAKSTQGGFRGTSMGEVDNPRTEAKKLAAVSVPELIPAADPGGPKATAVYQNVKVLGDLTENEFNRVMAAVAEWVAPKEGDNAGCAYCHNVENMADDTMYTHKVARRMFQMTRHINETWKPHVGATGVTCYTCHAGQPVPANIWFKGQDETAAFRMAGYRGVGQNRANRGVGTTSMTDDPFSDLIGQKGEPGQIRVQQQQVLPKDNTFPGKQVASIQSTEKTYALMIHMSSGLGVNCTYCHNSRAFGNWKESTPKRTSAWHGIRMVRDLNQDFLTPLQPVYPANRLGPTGDAPKAYCSTCHQGLAKPLNGAQMMKDYLELNKASLQ